MTNWAAIALNNHVPAAGEYWKGLLLYGPDMSCALTGIGGLSALTGLLRMIKTINAGHPVRGCLPAPRCRARPAAVPLAVVPPALLIGVACCNPGPAR